MAVRTSVKKPWDSWPAIYGLRLRKRTAAEDGDPDRGPLARLARQAKSAGFRHVEVWGAEEGTRRGCTFDSAKEARHFLELQMRERAGEIENLQCQPVFYLWVAHQPIARYTADFRYLERATRTWVVEDVKSAPTRTEAYRLRKTLVEAQYGVEIHEI